MITAMVSPRSRVATTQCYDKVAAFQIALTRRNNLRSIGHSAVFPLVASPFAVVVVPPPSPPPPASVISFSSVELGANGRTGKEWKKLLPYLRSRLGEDCNVSL
ncbi:hypothetical protein F2Q69_00018119 [Brassica cretica]|uniref:Uncharacterized protein n=1 Tax=Brassica cretica TaxID=69181 RepID=A0A8S9QJZ3_BRACR|nr:hypothetical protein F2Q69_00018119 [Brassica cretica]